jgi:hypothetical protein
MSNIRLGQNDLQGINTLAYLSALSALKISFVQLAADTNIMKLSFFVIAATVK